MGIGANGTLLLWTAQSRQVIDALERDGVSRVKREYVLAKYGDAGWAFGIAYGFYAAHARELVEPPEGAESGIWCYRSAKWADATAGSTLLELEVPAELAILFDLRTWNRILNLRYVPIDKADEGAFSDELARQGLTSTVPVFNTPFYPQLKRRIESSWERLFTSAEACPEGYQEAGLWEIRSEWVRRAIDYEKIPQTDPDCQG